MNFSSDNAAGIAPEILAAITDANSGRATAYGGDEVTAKAKAALNALFECEAEIFPLSTGSAANNNGPYSLKEISSKTPLFRARHKS